MSPLVLKPKLNLFWDKPDLFGYFTPLASIWMWAFFEYSLFRK